MWISLSRSVSHISVGLHKREQSRVATWTTLSRWWKMVDFFSLPTTLQLCRRTEGSCSFDTPWNLVCLCEQECLDSMESNTKQSLSSKQIGLAKKRALFFGALITIEINLIPVNSLARVCVQVCPCLHTLHYRVSSGHACTLQHLSSTIMSKYRIFCCPFWVSSTQPFFQLFSTNLCVW